MDRILNFIINNKEWIFSGVGVAIIAGMIGMIFRRKRKKELNIESGSRSTNIQAGDSAQITITSIQKDSDDNPEEIQRATLDDVKKYDPKTKELLRTLEDRKVMYCRRFSPLYMIISLVVLLTGLGIFIILIVKLIRWIISIF